MINILDYRRNLAGKHWACAVSPLERNDYAKITERHQLLVSTTGWIG
ncbi:MAG: hypothetical protein KKH17_12485 [Proteobacteria bacterium]|nr:hypothetical protein [Pseudomonadota bacterium]MBU4069088.1 hypothetical protein [Pseudomonadota bacterium]MBU4504012.1 hypothetical protein [Pseudomonadota bacterium]MCG2830233.1 hypothetical protein [Desulfobacteraceae bacterium]